MVHSRQSSVLNSFFKKWASFKNVSGANDNVEDASSMKHSLPFLKLTVKILCRKTVDVLHEVVEVPEIYVQEPGTQVSE